MKTCIRLAVSLALVSMIVVTANAREIKIKWRDTVEFKELEKAKKTAVDENKFLTILVSNEKYDSDHQGAEATVDVIHETIKGMKSFSVIVRATVSNIQGVNGADPFSAAVREGFQKAGNSLPMIIVINPAENKLVKVVPAQEVHTDGSKAFRDLKKAARDLKK
ncbi:hypothetical protein NT6N_10930 [Oceaniferula spumae]|uniref:TPM domain-containing protein n=1 Tax=Oceaniferula spumae TaxID=2979115 RepID=A0AAT9FJ66_9BACT